MKLVLLVRMPHLLKIFVFYKLWSWGGGALWFCFKLRLKHTALLGVFDYQPV